MASQLLLEALGARSFWATATSSFLAVLSRALHFPERATPHSESTGSNRWRATAAGGGSGGIVTTWFGNNTATTASAVAIQSDDKIVVAENGCDGLALRAVQHISRRGDIWVSKFDAIPTVASRRRQIAPAGPPAAATKTSASFAKTSRVDRVHGLTYLR